MKAWSPSAREAAAAARRGKKVEQPTTRVDKKAEAETNMKAGRTTSSKAPTNAGVNKSSVITVDHTEGVFKPASGEREGFRTGVEVGTCYKREAAAYEIDKVVGADLVPPTVIRTVVDEHGNKEVGSLQQFVTDAKVSLSADPKLTTGPAAIEAQQKLAVMDYLHGNSDRHVGNYMIREDKSIVAIDNGLQFPDAKASRPRDFNIGRIADERYDTLSAGAKDLIDNYASRSESVERVVKKYGLDAWTPAFRERLGILKAWKKTGSLDVNTERRPRRRPRKK